MKILYHRGAEFLSVEEAEDRIWSFNISGIKTVSPATSTSDGSYVKIHHSSTDKNDYHSFKFSRHADAVEFTKVMRSILTSVGVEPECVQMQMPFGQKECVQE